jgi:hypothetical protein
MSVDTPFVLNYLPFDFLNIFFIMYLDIGVNIYQDTYYKIIVFKNSQMTSKKSNDKFSLSTSLG